MAGHCVLLSVTATTSLCLLMILGSDAFTTLKVEKTLQFTYSGATGPGRWASLNPNFSVCATGKSQSPINIVANQAVLNKKLKPLIRDYHAVNVTLVDNKFTVAIEYPDHTGGINVDDKPYTLKQMHWHSPSEHRINGNRFAAELHMVHVSDDGKVVVVATLFQQGHPDPVLGMIEKKLNELANEYKSSEVTSPIEVGVFYPRELRETPSKYYRYIGSFSAPPCTQNVIYLVLAKARSISREQVEALKAPLDLRCKNNARPCQPINGRHVEICLAVMPSLWSFVCNLDDSKITFSVKLRLSGPMHILHLQIEKTLEVGNAFFMMKMEIELRLLFPSF